MSLYLAATWNILTFRVKCEKNFAKYCKKKVLCSKKVDTKMYL